MHLESKELGTIDDVRELLSDQCILSCLLKEDTLINNEDDTWEKLVRECQGKSVYLFGAGRMVKLYIDEIKAKIPVKCILDNDAEKDGTYMEGCLIRHPSVLKEENLDECIVVITSTVFSGIIYRELVKWGVKNIYSLLTMMKNEENRKNKIAFCQNYLDKMPIKKNKILVHIHPYEGYICHAKAIVQTLIERRKDYEIVWLTNKKADYPAEIRVVEYTQKNLLLELSDAGIFIFHDILHFGIPKKDGQLFIDTWHGCVALKKLGKYILNEKTDKEQNLLNVNETSKKTDYMMSNGKWCSEMYKDTFNYNGAILETGSPRLDCLFNESESVKKKMREELNIGEDIQVMVYAPTFREVMLGKKDGLLDFDIEKTKQVLSERFGGKWEVLIKLHPSQIQDIQNDKILKGGIWVKTGTDIYELLQITQILVTDFSSTMFEASFVGKKVFLFANDMEEYLQKERAMYFDYNELPYPKATCEEEFFDNIRTFDEKEYMHRIEWFNREVLGIIEDGNATARMVRVIEQYIEGAKNEEESVG